MEAGSLIHDYIAGAIGGTAGLVIGHPFDTTKVQLQTREGTAAFRSTLQAMKHISTHGWSHGFFRGLAFPFVSYGVVNSVFFGVYGNTLKAITGGNKAKASYSDIYWAGCVGGTAQLVIGCPVEVIKVVLQAQLPNDCTQAGMKYFAGPHSCAVWIYRKNGFVGFYRGLRTMAIRDIPTFGLYMVIYEYLCDHLPRGVVTTMLVGGVTGVATWTSSFPFDVVKSRLQADVTHARYTGMLNCAVKMYREGGVKIFFTGLGVTCLRAFPVNAVTLLFYSNTLKFLETLDAPAI